MPSSSQDSKPPHISVESCDFHGPSQKITSPRSIEACNRLGIDPKELYYIDFGSFLKQHVDLRNAPRQIQQFRYDHFERLRKSSVESVIKERSEIIKKQSEQRSTSVETGKVSSTLDQRMEKMIEEEKKMIDRIKRKQKLDIQSMIEMKIKAEMMKKASEDKENKLIEKSKELKLLALKRQAQAEEENRTKAEKRENEIRKQMEERKARIQEKREKEEKKLKERNEQETKRREELRKKAENEMNNMALHKAQIEAYLLSQEEALARKRELNEQRDKEKKKHLEKMRYERLKRSEMKSAKAKAMLMHSRDEVAKSLQRIRERVESKRKKTEKNLEEYYSCRDRSLQLQKEKNRKRRNNVLNQLAETEKNEQIKKKEYFEKRERLEQSLVMKEMERNDMARAISMKNLEHFNKIKENRSELETREDERKNALLQRMEEIERRLNEKRKIEALESLQKIEEGNAKQYEKDLALSRIKKAKEYRFKLKQMEIEEKEKKLEEIKLKQRQILKTKNDLTSEIEKQKQDIIKKFQSFMRQKKDINCEIVKELFPEDPDLYAKIKQITTTNNTSRGQSARVKSAHMLNDKEIEKKVEEFRNLLRSELSKIIEEEKQNENKRIKEYENANNNSDKKRIEAKNAKERADGNKKVKDFQADIENKVKIYENKLKKDYCKIYQS